MRIQIRFRQLSNEYHSTSKMHYTLYINTSALKMTLYRVGRKSRSKAFKTILINYLVVTHKPCFITFYKRTRILHPRKGEIFHPADFTSFDIIIHVILWCSIYGQPCIIKKAVYHYHYLNHALPRLSCLWEYMNRRFEYRVHFD